MCYSCVILLHPTAKDTQRVYLLAAANMQGSVGRDDAIPRDLVSLQSHKPCLVSDAPHQKWTLWVQEQGCCREPNVE